MCKEVHGRHIVNISDILAVMSVRPDVTLEVLSIDSLYLGRLKTLALLLALGGLLVLVGTICWQVCRDARCPHV